MSKIEHRFAQANRILSLPIFLRVLGESLANDELLEWYLALLAHVLGDARQILVDLRHHVLTCAVLAKNEIEHIATDLRTVIAPIATDQIQT